jgi:Circadian oscillating protein COP23
MKQQLLTSVVTGIAVTFTTISTMIPASYAAGNKFYCNQSGTIPKIFTRTPRGNLLIMNLRSQSFSSSGWNPKRRCEEISRRFQAYYDNGILKYITTGTMNGYPVVCITDRPNGNCTGLLFTLKRGSNAKKTLAMLLNQRGLAGGKSVYQGDKSLSIYVDMDEYIKNLEENSKSNSQ